MMSFLRDFKSADLQFVSEIPDVQVNRLLLGLEDKIWGVITFFLALAKFCFVLLQISVHLGLRCGLHNNDTLPHQQLPRQFCSFRVTRRERLKLTSLALSSASAVWASLHW